MTYTVQLKLSTTEHDRQLLERRFFLMFRIHNACVSVGKKRLRVMKRDSSYNQLKQEYIEKKKELTELKKENSVLLIEDKEKEIKELSEKLKIGKQRLGLTKSEFEKNAKKMQRMHKNELSSMQVQKEADRVFAGISKCMYSDAKEIHYKKYNDFDTISQKGITNGVKIKNNHILWGKGKYKLNIPIIIPNDTYIYEAMLGELKYAEIKKIEFSSGWRYYVVLYYEGNPPVKFKHGKEITGIDPGVSTVAACNDKNVMLEELAPEYDRYTREITHFQKKLDNARRLNNPNNYNPDGTIKKGKKIWIVTKNQKRLLRKIRILYRKQTAYTETVHRKQINNILKQSAVVIVEHMNWEALARKSKKTERSEKASAVKSKHGIKIVHKFKRKKRFGRSIRNRSPGKFIEFLKQKCSTYNVSYFEVDTMKYRASQLNHSTGEYEKVPLTQRFKTIDNHKVQRDLYSAYLISNAVINTKETRLSALDFIKCTKNFERFVMVQNKAIKHMKEAGISYRACFGF